MKFFQTILKPLIVTLSSLALGEGLTIKSTTNSFISSKVRTSRIHTIAEPQQLNFPTQDTSDKRNYIEEPVNKITPSFGLKSRIEKREQMKDLTSFDVKACWSKAGVGTCFVLEETNHKKFQVVFDLGCTPIFDKTMKVSNVVLSHTHLDHFGAIFGHARAHGMVCGGSTPTYYVPEELVPNLQKARELFSDIDASCRDDPESQGQKREKGLLNMNIVPIKAGHEVELKQSKVHSGIRYYIRAFQVSHCGHPALGYNLISKTKTKKLKEEYQGMEGKELGMLARSGATLYTTNIVEKIEACYSGDTNIDGLILNNEEIADTATISQNRQELKDGFKAPLIMCELTYLLEGERELAKERGHINLFDIQPILNSHRWGMEKESNYQSDQSGKKIVFYHLSSRGRSAQNILKSLAAVLPKNVADVTEVALASFLSETTSPILKDNGCISISDHTNFSNQKDSSE